MKKFSKLTTIIALLVGLSMGPSAYATTLFHSFVNDVSGEGEREIVLVTRGLNSAEIDSRVLDQVVTGGFHVADLSRSSGYNFTMGTQSVVKVASGENVQAVIEKLKKRPGVVAAMPNSTFRIAQTSNDTNFVLKDDLYNTGTNSGRTGGTLDSDIDVEQAWKVTGGTGAVIAVIDSGVYTTHPDLDANIWENEADPAGGGDNDSNSFVDDTFGWDFVDRQDEAPGECVERSLSDANATADNDPNPEPTGSDENGTGGIDESVTHGTHVAGIAAAELNNATGVTGVAPAAQIMALRALDDENCGTLSEIAAAMNYAVDMGADVINMSISGSYIPEFDDFVQWAFDNGVAVVVAAGNSGVNLTSSAASPVNNDCGSSNCVIGVGAVENDDTRTWYSNYSTGSNNFIDVSAPGGAAEASTRSVYSTFFYNGTPQFNSLYGYSSGTSMAAPQVAGAVALLRAENPSLTVSQITDRIRDYSDPNTSSGLGAGRLNAGHAVNSSIMTRFDGGVSSPTRYDEAVQVSKMSFPRDGSATAVVVASGTSFADGLAGAGLARNKNAPLLLTDKSGMSAATLTEIQRVLGNTSRTVYILGGTGAISSNIETQLSGVSYNTTQRVVGSGVDRVDTAIGIANITNPGSTTEVIMVNKDNFPDGVSASAVVADRGIPLLVNASGWLDSRNSTWLDTHNVSRVYLVGGTTVLQSILEAQLNSLGITDIRLANTDRYGTSAEVAKCFYSTTSDSPCNGVTSSRAAPKRVGFAVGTNFPDALSGGPYMGFYEGPILLTQTSSVPSFISTYASSIQSTARDGFIFGGTAVISSFVSSSLAGLLD